MDWAAAMTETRENAEKAATMAERTLGAVAEMKAESRRSSQAAETLARLDRLAAVVAELGAAQREAQRPQALLAPCRPSWLPTTAAAAAGALLGFVACLWSC